MPAGDSSTAVSLEKERVGEMCNLWEQRARDA